MLAFLLACLLNAQTALARGGTVVGDGGHSVVCDFGGGQSSIQLLDLYQAESRLGFGFIELSIIDRSSINSVLDQLSLANNVGTASEHIRNAFLRARMMQNSLEFVTELPSTTDMVMYESLPPNCQMKQLGITNYMPGSVPVSVDKEDWARLDQVQRAVFLLHESLHYEIADPEGVRQVVAYLVGPVIFQVQNKAVIEKIFATGQAAMWSDFAR